ncbi:DNA-binding response regulator [Herbaspirillum sp. meg3]|jgi:two-component system KDP operon response regulator KdpE|uniref:response regulator n=1 Tax=Herbaspirillum sp. meg3 TaxID=2025949 RepID=UPI000B980386|nr:response regulator [Herbaspirillum sp. meg3]ASU37902.1 DNA-binding response regulator [Herbaspirillum sp. meg3]
MLDHAGNIVFVEDDAHIRKLVRGALEQEGFVVHEARTAREGMVEAGTRKPDLVIVDLGLPDQDGKQVIADIRSWSDVPIVILSARTQEAEKVAALDAGADDYLTKPFGVPELLARIRAQLRRRSQASAATGRFRLGDLLIDLPARTASKGGEPVHLTQIEHRLISTLLRDAGRVITHRQLLAAGWGPSHTEDHHYLRIYMQRLRQKLEQDSAQPKYILTEIGVGYRIVNAEPG